MKGFKPLLICATLAAFPFTVAWADAIDDLAQMRELERGVVKDYLIATKTVLVDGKRYKIPSGIETGELHVSRGEWVEMEDVKFKPGDVILYKPEGNLKRSLQVIYRVVE